MELQDIKAELGRKIYDAVIEVLEPKEIHFTGNAHHKAQDIAEYAMKKLDPNS